MGAIRLFLAFVVVIDHVGGIVLHPLGLGTSRYMTLGLNAGHAVMFFYVISGFLISYVLEGKYPPTPQGTYRFYKSRAIRIYALYWAVYAVSCLILDPGQGRAIWAGRLGDLLPGLFLFGSDWRVAFGDYPDAYFRFFPTGLHPAWSLGAEMTFYAMAPFLLRSLTMTVFIFFMSAAVRAALIHAFGFFENWTYYFFPSTLLFFLLGHLSRVLSARLRLSPRLACGFLLPSLLFALLSAGRSFDDPYFYLSIGCFAAALPGLFTLTKDTRALNFMGDISYAVYLTHPLVVTYILPLSLIFLLRMPYLSSHAFALACAIALLGIALTATVATGVEMFAEKRMAALLRGLFGWAEASLPPPGGRQLVTLFGVLAALAVAALAVHHFGPPPAAISSLATIVKEARLASLPNYSGAPAANLPASPPPRAAARGGAVVLPLAPGEAEGAAVAAAPALRTPGHEPAYALEETRSDGFHRVNVPLVATYPNKLNVIRLYVHPLVRTRLRIEFMEIGWPHYGRADFDLSSGRATKAGEAAAATIAPLEGGWFLVSLAMLVADARAAVSIALLDPDERVKYEGEPGKGLILGFPVLQAQ